MKFARDSELELPFLRAQLFGDLGKLGERLLNGAARADKADRPQRGVEAIMKFRPPDERWRLRAFRLRCGPSLVRAVVTPSLRRIARLTAFLTLHPSRQLRREGVARLGRMILPKAMAHRRETPNRLLAHKTFG